MFDFEPHHLKSTVRISTSNENLGTGFYYFHENKALYLITAKHVLFKPDGEVRTEFFIISSAKYKVDEKVMSPIQIDLKKSGAGMIIKHPKYDVCLLLVGIADNGSLNNPSYAVYEATGFAFHVALAKHSLSFANIKLAKDVLAIGYPTSLNLYSDHGFTLDTPFIRKGVVSMLNTSNKHIVLDCELNYGNSGGPVYQIVEDGLKQSHKLIGVASSFVVFNETYINPKNLLQHNFATNSGYSVVVPMDYVFELLEKPYYQFTRPDQTKSNL